jgi:hypothetical protein
MKLTVLGSAVAVATCCVSGAFAQQRPSATSTPAHNVFKLTGCLMAGANASDTFKLTDVATPDQTARAGAGEPGAVGTSGRNASYELRPVSGLGAQGVNADDLKAHVGHRVEVVVRPIEHPAPAPSLTGGSLGAARPNEPAVERYSVTSIERTVGRCS